MREPAVPRGWLTSPDRAAQGPTACRVGKGTVAQALPGASRPPRCPLPTLPCQAISHYRWEAGPLSDNAHARARTLQIAPAGYGFASALSHLNSRLACKGSLSPPGCLGSQVPSEHLGLGICTSPQPDEPVGYLGISSPTRPPPPSSGTWHCPEPHLALASQRRPHRDRYLTGLRVTSRPTHIAVPQTAPPNFSPRESSRKDTRPLLSRLAPTSQVPAQLSPTQRGLSRPTEHPPLHVFSIKLTQIPACPFLGCQRFSLSTDGGASRPCSSLRAHRLLPAGPAQSACSANTGGKYTHSSQKLPKGCAGPCTSLAAGYSYSNDTKEDRGRGTWHMAAAGPRQTRPRPVPPGACAGRGARPGGGPGTAPPVFGGSGSFVFG